MKTQGRTLIQTGLLTAAQADRAAMRPGFQGIDPTWSHTLAQPAL